MPTTRKRKKRTINALQPWETAFLTGDESVLRPGTRDLARLSVLRSDPDGWLLFGDRTARQLLKDFPEFKKSVNLPPKNRPIKIESPTDRAFQGLNIFKMG